MVIHRLGNQYCNEKGLDNLIELIKKYPKACSEVWFPSDYGYPPKEVMQKKGKAMFAAAQKLRALGVKVSLQISNTVGHGEYNKVFDFSGADFQPIVGYDGTESPYSFCADSQGFHDYLKMEMEAYCGFQPYAVWVDDDFRLVNHYPVSEGCFCDHCIEKFNSQHGQNFTREELVQNINDSSSFEWRDRWVAFEQSIMIRLISDITKSIVAVSKDSKIGLQHCVSPIYTGGSHTPFFDAIYKISGNAPLSRPGGGFYDEYVPRGMIDKAYSINKQVAASPAYIPEIVAEMEDLPHTPMGKSVRANCIEGSLDIALGCNKLSLTTLCKVYETDWHDKTFCGLAQYESYWEDLIESNRDTTVAGVKIYKSSNLQHIPMTAQSKLFAWTNDYMPDGISLAQAGLPLTYEDVHDAPILLHSAQVSHLSHQEIETLLNKPVITDGHTIAQLCQRGYADHFPIDVVEETSHSFSVLLSKHRFNQGHEGEVWGYCDFSGRDNLYELLPKNEEVQVMEEFIVAPTNEKKGSCSVLLHTDQGGQWAVFGSHFWDPNLTTGRRQLLLRVADCLSDGLSAYIETVAQVVVIPRVNNAGEVVNVTLLNTSIDTLPVLTLVIKNPVSERFTWKSAHFEKILDFNRNQSFYRIKIDPLAPWEIATVFVEK